MKQRSNCEHPLQLIAAAVLLALGSTQVGAQQAGSEQQSESQQAEQQQQQQPGAASEQQQPGAASEQQDSEFETAQADTQASGGAEALDQIAEEHEDLSTFVEAVKAAGMEDALTEGTDYTVFAPTNEAFEQMSGMSTEELMQPENREQLIGLLRAHIVADDVDETMARSLQEAQTIDGGTVDLGAEQDEIQVGDASVVESGIQSGSLRVYAIDGVLSQDTAVARADQAGGQQESGAGAGAGAGQAESERDDPFDTESGGDDPFDTESEGDDPFDIQDSEGDDPFDTQGQDQPGQPGAQSPGQAGQEEAEDQIGSQN